MDTDAWRVSLPAEKFAVFYTIRGRKMVAGLSWGNVSAAELPLCSHYVCSLLSKPSPNEQSGKILDMKLWDRTETRYIGSRAVVAKTE